MDLIREYWWVIVIVVALVLAFILMRPKQRVTLTDSAPVRPHMQHAKPREGRGIAGEAAAAASDVTEGVYNVASGTETSLAELARTLLRVMESPLHLEHGPERAVNGVVRRLADVTNARRDLGFEAAVGLEDGLRSLVQWWRPLREEIAAARMVTRPDTAQAVAQ